MMNLISFEAPPLGRQDSTIATTTIKATKEASSSGKCFHGSHLDLSLGISLSNGSSRCGEGIDAGCGGAMASYGRRGAGGGSCNIDSGMLTTTTANVHSTGHGVESRGDWMAAAFMPSPTGFMHPWSLAARQQTAAAELDQSLARSASATPMYMPRDAVGWPPVHTSRRNFVTAMNNPKPDNVDVKLDRPKGETMALNNEKNLVVERNISPTAEARSVNMFAKVHMDGYMIGRKINLRAHHSYDSLRKVLSRMTHNFFCPADHPSTNSREEDHSNSKEFIFLYEDFEGDRMLVGDVPWELFLASAKRLYITRNPTSENKGHGEGAKIHATEGVNK